MSVSSILAFVLAGVAAKTRHADRTDEKQRAELIALRIDNSDLRRELDQAREDYASLRRENAAQAHALRCEQRAADFGHSHGLQTPQPAGPDFRPPQIALQQHAAAQQMQQAQLAQYQHYQAAAQNQGLGQMGLLGAQNLIDTELWCNCVPSRSQVWAADRT